MISSSLTGRLAALLAIALLVLAPGCGAGGEDGSTAARGAPERIVSLSPTATESGGPRVPRFAARIGSAIAAVRAARGE